MQGFSVDLGQRAESLYGERCTNRLQPNLSEAPAEASDELREVLPQLITVRMIRFQRALCRMNGCARRWACVHARFALRLKGSHHGIAPGEHRQRRAERLRQRTDQQNT